MRTSDGKEHLVIEHGLISSFRIGEQFIDEDELHTCTELIFQGDEKVQVGVRTDTGRNYTETGKIYPKVSSATVDEHLERLARLNRMLGRRGFEIVAEDYEPFPSAGVTKHYIVRIAHNELIRLLSHPSLYQHRLTLHLLALGIPTTDEELIRRAHGWIDDYSELITKTKFKSLPATVFGAFKSDPDDIVPDRDITCTEFFYEIERFDNISNYALKFDDCVFRFIRIDGSLLITFEGRNSLIDSVSQDLKIGRVNGSEFALADLFKQIREKANAVDHVVEDISNGTLTEKDTIDTETYGKSDDDVETVHLEHPMHMLFGLGGNEEPRKEG